MNDQATAFERYLPIRLSVVASRLTRVIWRVYGPRFGLSASEWRAIAVLARFGAMPLVNVMHRAEIEKVRMSRAVTRLVNLGYVTRDIDARDRRRAILRLTDAGRSLCGQIVPLVIAAEAEVLEGLTASERETLLRVVERLTTQLNANVAEPVSGGPAL